MIYIDGIYIHFPFCRHLCNYCDFYKFPINDKSIEEFKRSISKQISLIDLDKFNYSNVKTIYLGGGTPSLWGDDLVVFLNELAHKLNINIKSLEEVTLEVDPDTWTEKNFDSWLGWGINRYSVGVQSFDEKILRTLDRRHSLGDIERTLKYLGERELNYSVDFLMGAPTLRDSDIERNIISEIDEVLKFNPQHVSAYILKTRANYPLKDRLPIDDDIVKEYDSVSEFLKSNNFIHYEVSNFAKQNKESQHNKSYWTLKNVLALGPNATGFYKKNLEATRYQVSAKSQKLVEEKLTQDQLKLEEIYLSLRTNLGINPKDYFSTKGWGAVLGSLNKWHSEGFLQTLTDESLVLNSKGFLVVDNLIDEFFKYKIL